MNAVTAALLERAADDEATMRVESLREIPFGQHAQAAIEKLLKALINERGVRHPRKHDLDLLVHELTKLDEELPPLPIVLGDLSDYAGDLRYGGSAKLAQPLDRKACL